MTHEGFKSTQDVLRALKSKFLRPQFLAAHSIELTSKNDILKKAQSADISPCGIYFLIQNNEIVYVGKSNSVYFRISQHLKHGTKKFDSFAYIECSEEQLDVLEARYYLKFRPAYNAKEPIYVYAIENQLVKHLVTVPIDRDEQQENTPCEKEEIS